MQTVRQRIETIRKKEELPERMTTWNKCNPNAKTCCLGKNFIVLQYTNQAVGVYAYDKAIEPKANIPIVTRATAQFDSKSDQTCILITNEVLYYGLKI